VVGDHDYKLEKFIGKGEVKKLKGGITEMLVKFAPTEYAQFVRELKEADIPLMASIGFIPHSYDDEDPSIITNAEVIEVSIVVVGSNRDANIKTKMTDRMIVKCKDFGIDILEEKGQISEELNGDVREKQKMFRPVADIISAMYYVWYD
jgi:hypothetical protein